MRRKGIRIHRSRTLTPDLVTRRNNIPVTKPSRTIADLRGAVSPKELRRAIRQADVLGLSLELDVESDRTRSSALAATKSYASAKCRSSMSRPRR
jgi:hypothetical protein